MTPHNYLFACSVLLLVGLAAGLLVAALRREQMSVEVKWEEIITRLDRVNRDAVHTIATDLLEGRDEIAPEALFAMLDGLDGLVRLESNCAVLVELATYVQRWHPEAVVVAEELRLSAREMTWHIERLRGAAAAGHLRTTFPDNAQQAIRVYYGMTRRVLSLYEDTALAQVAALQHSL